MRSNYIVSEVLLMGLGEEDRGARKSYHGIPSLRVFCMAVR